MSSVRIINADVVVGLGELPDESVHCVVTSPPYWSLRDYQVEGQIGLEPTLGDHLARIVEVFRAVRRVLRKDGVVFLNYGDAYAASPNGRSAADTKAIANDDRTFRDKPCSSVGPIYAELATSEHDATRSTGKESYRPAHGKRIIGKLVKWDRKSERSGHNLGGEDGAVADHRIMQGGILKPKDRLLLPARVAIALHEDGWWIRDEIIWHKPNPMPSSVRDRTTCAHEMIYMLTKSARYYYDAAAIAEPIAESSKARYEQATIDGQPGGHKQDLYEKHGLNTGRARSRRTNEIIKDLLAKKSGLATANKRSVWTIPTEPYPDAHFATFPSKLTEPCIKAVTSEKGCCAKCGAPWVREVEVGYDDPGNRTTNGARSLERRYETAGFPVRLERRTETTGWSPSCKCDADIVPCTVLDPFGGSGTVGLVCKNLNRNAILIEISAKYCRMADVRINGPLFASREQQQEARE